MKNINKNVTESLIPKHLTTLKKNKGCLNRQPFSFVNISIDITYNKNLLQNQISHSTNKPSGFICQTEILEIAPIMPLKPPPKTYSFHPFENGGIILYRLMVSF